MVEGKKNQKSFLSGIVISDKMDKTVVVKSQRTYRHTLLGKTMRSLKKYKVHDEANIAKVGDRVEFYEGRPVSKSKYMYLGRVVKQNSATKKD